MRKALRVPLEVEARLHVPSGAAVERQHVAGNLAQAQLGGDGGGLLGRAVIRFGHPQSQAPQRNVGCATGELRVAFDDLCRISAADEEQVQRLVLDHDAVGSMRPVGVPDAMRDPSGRVHENSPRVLAGARTPAERSILVRQPGVDAQGVGDLRMDDLAALVQRTELFSEAVHRFTGCKCERAHPLRRPARAADDG